MTKNLEFQIIEKIDLKKNHREYGPVLKINNLTTWLVFSDPITYYIEHAIFYIDMHSFSSSHMPTDSKDCSVDLSHGVLISCE